MSRRSAPGARPRSQIASGAATAALLVAVALLVAAAIGAPAGLVVLGVGSDSMSPLLRTGDVVVTRSTPVREIKRGDVITFPDPTRGGALTTHRVVDLDPDPDAGRVGVVTKGDANEGREEWSIETDGTVGRLVVALPKLGGIVGHTQRSWLPPVLTLIAGCGTAVLLRGVWS